jgi:hypothetical protein
MPGATLNHRRGCAATLGGRPVRPPGHVTSGSEEDAAPGAVASLVQAVRTELNAARLALPTRRPTPEEEAEDPGAFETCLQSVREALAAIEEALDAAEVGRG